MNVIITDPNLYMITNCDSMDELKEKIHSYILEKLRIISVDHKMINNVYIASNNENYYARLDTISHDPIVCNMIIAVQIIWYLYRGLADKRNLAESVIMHELYHCREHAYTFSALDYSKICFDPISYDDLCLNIGYHQWSEYYAHFYSSKICISDNIKVREKYPLNIHEELISFTHQTFHKEGDYAELYNSIVHPFIRNCIIMLANYNSTQDIAVKSIIDNFKTIDDSIKQYFNKVNGLMEDCYGKYPNVISYKYFYKIGKELLTF